jgi:hypothetical protein
MHASGVMPEKNRTIEVAVDMTRKTSSEINDLWVLHLLFTSTSPGNENSEY